MDRSDFSHKITIPSVLVDEVVGDAFIKNLSNGSLNPPKVTDKKRDKVVVSVDFEMNVLKHSSLFYLLEIGHYQSYKTFKDLNTVFEKIKEMIKLSPIYKVSNLPAINAAIETSGDWDCLHKNEFC